MAYKIKKPVFYIGFFIFEGEEKMKEELSCTEQLFCMICGSPVAKGKLCECCRESLALCDIEDYAVKKTQRENCSGGENAFK